MEIERQRVTGMRKLRRNGDIHASDVKIKRDGANKNGNGWQVMGAGIR